MSSSSNDSNVSGSCDGLVLDFENTAQWKKDQEIVQKKNNTYNSLMGDNAKALNRLVGGNEEGKT